MARRTPNLNLFVPDPGQSGIAADLNQNYDTIDATVDATAGHKHTGTPGAGPKLDATALATTGTADATTYLRGDMQWATPAGSGGGVTDHGALTGLTDDDHPQYLNQPRGDMRYLQRSANLLDVANPIAARDSLSAAPAVHTHAAADLTSGILAPDRLASGAPTPTTYLRGDQTWAPLAADYAALAVVLDGGGSALTTGIKADLEIPFDCTILRATLLADVAGSIVVDLWKAPYASYPPTVTNTITASAKPTITSAVKGQLTTLTGWTVACSAGDILRVNVDAVSTITRCLVSLRVSKS